MTITAAEKKLVRTLTEHKTAIRDARSLPVIKRLAEKGIVEYHAGTRENFNGELSTYYWVNLK